MKIVIVTMHFPPDGGPSAPLALMLVRELTRRGHEVVVVTGTPSYPTGRPAPAWRTEEPQIDRARIVRIWLPALDRSNLALRALQFLSFQCGSFFFLISTRRYDAAFVSNPAIQSAAAVAALRLRGVSRILYSIADVYPQVGVRIGRIRSSVAISLVAALERACFKLARKVRVISPAFAPLLEDIGCPAEKIVLIPDWVDIEEIQVLQGDTAFRIECGLAEDFVIQYAGNLGLSQGLETVVEAAVRLLDMVSLRVLFVGEGAGRQPLQDYAARVGANNVSFVDFQPRSRLSEVLATADIALVSLLPGLTESIPSKIYSALASGRPIIAAVEGANGAVPLLRESGAAIIVPPGDAEAMASAIRDLVADPKRRREMGQSARRWAAANLSPEMGAARIEEYLL